MPDFICIGVPYFLGQHLPERTEVAAIRNSDFPRQIGAQWVDVVPAPDGAQDPVTAVNRALADAITAHRDRLPIIFASDCVSAIGASKGLATSDGLGIIWFDAHGDFNTPDTTPSGFLGGMPLAMLVGRGEQHLMDGVGLAPLDERDILLTDARDLDPGEAEALRYSHVTHLPDITTLKTVPLPDKPLYIHLDVDVVNPDDMPDMSYAAPGGPSLDEVAAALKRVARDGQIAGLLVSLWNDALVTDRKALEGTLTLVRAFVESV